MIVRSRLLQFTTLLGALAGCRHDLPWPPTPASLHWGEDACDGCRMIVSDQRFAAELCARNGAVERYDDLGCLLERHGDSLDPAGVFVRDFGADRWLRGDTALVLHAPGRIASPMGHGYAAFASAADAEAAARNEPAATIMRLSELLQLGGSRAAVPEPDSAVNHRSKGNENG
ncbi:MAG: hypothetical protein U1E76_12300 [Planctomycetota bacterium]